MMIRRYQRSRSGSVVLEALLAFPLLAIVTLAAVQFGQTLAFEQVVVAVAEESAREAAKGANADQVADVVQTILSPYGLSVDPGVRVDIEQTTEPTWVTLGDASLPDPPSITFVTAPTDSLADDEIRVTVQVSFVATRVPNLLSCFGVDFSDARYSSTALAVAQ